MYEVDHYHVKIHRNEYLLMLKGGFQVLVIRRLISTFLRQVLQTEGTEQYKNYILTPPSLNF